MLVDKSAEVDWAISLFVGKGQQFSWVILRSLKDYFSPFVKLSFGGTCVWSDGIEFLINIDSLKSVVLVVPLSVQFQISRSRLYSSHYFPCSQLFWMLSSVVPTHVNGLLWKLWFTISRSCMWWSWCRTRRRARLTSAPSQSSSWPTQCWALASRPWAAAGCGTPRCSQQKRKLTTWV